MVGVLILLLKEGDSRLLASKDGGGFHSSRKRRGSRLLASNEGGGSFLT